MLTRSRWGMALICGLLIMGCGDDDGEVKADLAGGGEDAAVMEDMAVEAEDLAAQPQEDMAATDMAGDMAEDMEPDLGQEDVCACADTSDIQGDGSADGTADTMTDAEADAMADTMADMEPDMAADVAPDMEPDMAADMAPDMSLWTEVSLEGLTPFQVVLGVQELSAVVVGDGAVAQVELMVDGVQALINDVTAPGPFALPWDTTTAEEGVRILTVAALDGEGHRQESGPYHVIVANRGMEIVLDEGSTGQVVIPDPYLGEDVDQKRHWTMADGMGRAVGAVAFEDPWSIKLDIGTGNCPHSGQALADNASRDGRLWVDYQPGATLPTGMWFIHIGALDAPLRPGETLPFSFVVVVWPEE